MKPAVLGIVIALALGVVGYMFLSPAPLAAPTAPLFLTYANDQYGVSFSYPEGYLLSEEAIGATHYVITLIKEEDAVPVVAGGEGPTAITIDIYDTTASLQEWLSLSTSNYSLGDGTLASTTVAGFEAVHYGWSGLYEGETTALSRNGRIFALSVTYFSPSDTMRSAYDIVLDSLVLR